MRFVLVLALDLSLTRLKARLNSSPLSCRHGSKIIPLASANRPVALEGLMLVFQTKQGP